MIALCQKQYYIYFIAWHNNRGSSNHRDSNKFEIDTINSRWCFRKKCAPHTHAHTSSSSFLCWCSCLGSLMRYWNTIYVTLIHASVTSPTWWAQNVAKGRGKDAIFGPEPMAIIQHSFILFSRTTHVHRYMTMENEWAAVISFDLFYSPLSKCIGVAEGTAFKFNKSMGYGLRIY